ncbi:uncharacterized protein NPIL_561831 [Nephila pilipes]|uniref:Uncharacterized protein n=1 Tax=Nephila pilipes TaxID=299642 RepID=A0A8X6IVQ8_NEPPI|nr:uncharacterized protein NPIL_561831 [Nephila pilipes]
MENFSDNNGNGSSIFQGKIREQDFSAEQKLNELKAAIEELNRQDLLRRLECEHQASSCIDEVSFQAELHIKDDEDYSNGERERVLGDFWNFFESLFNLFEVDVDDPKIYQMLKEKKEKNLIAAIMKFLRDKLKELIKKIFTSNLDLSWDKRLDKEIKELQEKLGSGELSEEEFARAFERLQTLMDLKLRLQMAVTGWIVTMFAEMFGVELAAAVEASTEKEDKKAEKTSLKEENKEVHKDVEIKVDEREKPKVPVSLFEVSPGFVRPVPLSKPELDLLPKPIMPKEVIKEEIREVKETKVKVEEEKKAKPEGPKVAVCPPKKPAPNTTEMGPRVVQKTLELSGRDERRGSGNVSDISDVNSKKVPTIKSTNVTRSISEQRADDACAEFAKEFVNFRMTTWNGAENEGSVNNAQPPKGLTNDVKVEKCVEGQSAGKAP